MLLSPVLRDAFTTLSNLSGLKVICMRCWNVAVALHKPYGIRVNSYRPNGVLNAVLCWSPGAICTWLYADCRSSVVKYYAPVIASNDSTILGSGRASLIVLLLSAL